MLAAWATGMSLKESAGLGALLNTRGLIALVVFNIGLELRVISVAVFSMLVIMALVNTILTTWLLDFFGLTGLMKRAPGSEAAVAAAVSVAEAPGL